MFKLLWNPTVLTCNLTIGDFPPCTGIQKLTGFSRGWHHWNSIRLGYNRDTETSPMRLFMYAYVGGVQISKYIAEFEAGTKITAQLHWMKSLCAIEIFNFGDKYARWDAYHQRFNKTIPIGYQLFPYAEIDGTEIRTPFNPDIRDVVVR